MKFKKAKYDAGKKFRTYHNQKNRRIEELITQKVQVLAVQSLNYCTNDD